MDIVFTINNQYCKNLGVVMVSILSWNPSITITFHVISDYISSKNKNRLSRIIRKSNCKLIFYDFKNLDFTNIKIDGHAATINYFRLFLSDILPRYINKVLYLDSDLFVLKDIRKLWQKNISGYAIAAVNHPNLERSKSLGIKINEYFNSGVMLINLKYWRDNNLIPRFKEIINYHIDKIKYWDQDVLNIVLNGNVKYIDNSWNDNNKKKINDASIIHFTGKYKPWSIHYNWDIYKDLYYKYLLETPFFISDFKNVLKYLLRKAIGSKNINYYTLFKSG